MFNKLNCIFEFKQYERLCYFYVLSLRYLSVSFSGSGFYAWVYRRSKKIKILIMYIYKYKKIFKYL